MIELTFVICALYVMLRLLETALLWAYRKFVR